jgi:hypothetical protein
VTCDRFSPGTSVSSTNKTDHHLPVQIVNVQDKISYADSKKKIGFIWCLIATFNNISVISWWSVLLVEETEVPGENLSQVTDKLYHNWIIFCYILSLTEI